MSGGSRAMKKLVLSIALVGLVVLAACTSDSPTAPGNPTTPPQEWVIATLTVGDTNPYIGVPIVVEATIQQNGGAAPNGTAVEFVAVGPDNTDFGFSNGAAQIVISTVSGRASVEFTADQHGLYTIQARVQNVSRQVVVSYLDPNVDEDLVIQLPLVPNIGSFNGGETVILRGTGIAAPAEVIFSIDGILFPAVVVETIESVPLSAAGQITISTPVITGVDPNQAQLADVIVKRGVGTPSQLSRTLPSAFTFVYVDTGGPPVLFATFSQLRAVGRR